MSRIKYASKFIKCDRPLKELSKFDLIYINQKLGFTKSAIYSNQFVYCRKLYATRPPKLN